MRRHPLPLMRRHDVDLWIILSRENAPDPLVSGDTASSICPAADRDLNHPLIRYRPVLSKGEGVRYRRGSGLVARTGPARSITTVRWPRG